MKGHLRTQIRVICTHRPGSSVHTFRGWGGVGKANRVHVPVHTQTQQTLSSFLSPADTGTFLGMGWGGVGDNVHVPVHTQAHQTSWLISYRWGGVWWGNNVHVPVHTQAHAT